MRSCGDLATYTPAKLGIGSAEDDGADVIAETAKPRRLCDTYKKKAVSSKLSSISLFSFCCCCEKAKRENKQINKCFACVYAAMGGGLSKWKKKRADNSM